MGLHTSQGVFVRIEDVKKLMDEQKATREIETKTEPKPKDMSAARRAILKDEEIMKNFPPPSRGAGRSLPAADSQTSSRT